MKEHIKFLKGKKVYLRPVLREDISRFLQWINDGDVRCYLENYLPVFEKEEEEWFDNLSRNKGSHIVFAVVDAETHKLIGNMGLAQINWKDRTAVSEAMIGDSNYWGKGYGTEAKMILLNYAFNTLNLRKICASVIAFNERSYKYQLKCGYIKEGVKRKQCYHEGKYWDEILMAVFKENWSPIWKGYKRKNF